MIPQEKAKDLIKKFGKKAEAVAIEIKNSVDALRTPYWKSVINEIMITRFKSIKLEIDNKPPCAYRYE